MTSTPAHSPVRRDPRDVAGVRRHRAWWARLARRGEATRSDRYGERPVRWLAADQLARTAIRVALSEVFARFADKREAMLSVPGPLYVLTRPGDTSPITVDYVSDTGDGFDATLQVARHLRRDLADLLVLGGDQVYPTASADAYRQRLVRVLATATETEAGGRRHPPAFAIPGNHDWYDGLVAFRRLFCETWAVTDPGVEGGEAAVLSELPVVRVGRAETQALTSSRDPLGGWVTAQNRSYFAIRVHPKWWLWGIDSQLDAPIDAGQLRYFVQAEGAVKRDDGVVICTATPSWLQAGVEAEDEGPPEMDADSALQVLGRFLRQVFGAADPRVRLLLTGDKHHLAHYAPRESVPAAAASPDTVEVPGPHLITAGGGGAFTSTTHHLPAFLVVPWGPARADPPPRSLLDERPAPGPLQVTRYDLATTYPDKPQSESLTRRLLPRIGWRNGWSFPALVGVVLAGLLGAVIGDPRLAVLENLTPLAVLLLLVGGIVRHGARDARPGEPLWRLVLTTLVAATALAVPVLVARRLAGDWWRGSEHWPPLWYVVAVLVLAVPGTALVTAYFVWTERRGWHQTEVAGGMRSEQHKHVLRMRFTSDRVTVSVVGFDDDPPRHSAVDLPPTAGDPGTGHPVLPEDLVIMRQPPPLPRRRSPRPERLRAP